MGRQTPSADPRRASALRQALENSAPMLAPEWAGLDQQGDFGRALVEIAARLAEHSTSRLDQTAFRDKLAFLDALDLSTPSPQPATAPIVFTLVEKRETPVFAPARVQLTAENDGQEISFETREAIDITPARLAALIAADPAADHIERAPAFVTDGLGVAAPPTRYILLSAVETGATTLQLVQAIDIEPGDLLRLRTAAYRVEKVEGAIVRLRDPLQAGAPAGAAVEKLIALDSFDLRDLQFHAAYFGHKELLKLDGRATVTLVFDPPGLASRLAALDIEYRMWGTGKNQDAPAWHDLHLLGAGADGLYLAKSWEGSVDELEIGACNSRWVRLRLRRPIAGPCGQATSAVSVELKVASAVTDQGASGEGSQSVTAAFHNGQPLPTSGAFYPFGPEPQRFDTFALAAPEALSKKGATVRLDVTLDDASLHAMAAAAFDRVYGVSANGRLQSVRFAGTSPAEWRQLGLAPEETATGPTAAGGATVRLDATAPLCALEVSPQRDLVFALDARRLIRKIAIDTNATDWSVGKWESLAMPAKGTALGFCLVPASQAHSGAPPAPALLIAASGGSFYRLPANAPSGLAADWVKIDSNLSPSGPVTLAAAQARADGATLVLIDPAGRIYRGDYVSAQNKLLWTPFPQPAGAGSFADASTRPVAWLEDSKLVVLAARSTAGPPQADPLLLMHQAEGEKPSPRPDLRARLGTPKSILGLAQGGSDAAERPLIAVTGTRGILLWGKGGADVPGLPQDASPAAPYGLILPGPPGLSPSLLLNAGSELLLQLKLAIPDEAVTVVLHDVIWSSADAPEPTHVLTTFDSLPHSLAGAGLAAGTDRAYAAPASGIGAVSSYLPLRDLEASFSGASRDPNNHDQMPLDAGDNVTEVGDVLKIHQKLYAVTDVDSTTGAATFDRNLPGGSFSYRIFRPTDSPRPFGSPNRERLARIVAGVPAGGSILVFKSPADPEEQAIFAADDEWLLLEEEWQTHPQSTAATLIGEPSLFPPTPIRLPRNIDNPELSWEYFDGSGWRRLDGRSEWKFKDFTHNLAESKWIQFVVPPDLSPTEIAGKEDYWIRARLVGGDYGRPVYVIATQPPPPSDILTQSITVDRSRLNPPEIIRLEASYVLDQSVPPDCVQTDNNLALLDQTQAAFEQGALFNLFEGVAQHVGDGDGGSRALYLGFGKRPGVAALNLYAEAVDRDAAPRVLVAEVLTPEGWAPIRTADETAALTRPGLIRLYLHPAPAQLPLFGRDGWWLRLRPERDSAEWAPLLRGLFVNAAIAEHARSVRQELLGSSLGEPDQRYRLTHRPVLPATLELRVRESLGAEERAVIETEAGPAAVRGADPNLPGEWVAWRRVDTFVDEPGDARVFRLDPASGEVQFGNGRQGKIPPAGPDSIRAFSYQAGGGSAGNVPALAIAKLSSAIESVELAVNPIDASGGADMPTIERIASSVPALLRHGGRALAPADIEALAIASAPDVVGARFLERRSCAIELAVAIRGTNARCPVPSRARREGIARSIVAAGWGALAPDDVTVCPPRYVHVEVEAVVAAASIEAVAGVDRDVRAALVAFLHPTNGGCGGLGWPFGRRVWPSDLAAAIADVAGLDRVVAIDVAPKDEGGSLDAMPPDGLVCVEEDDIQLVVLPPEGVR